MLNLETWMDFKALHKEGLSIKQIARQTGYSRNTVRRVLREPAPAGFQSPERSSCLDPYKAYLQDRWQTTGLNAVRLLAEIQHMGYGGSIATLRRYLAPSAATSPGSNPRRNACRNLPFASSPRPWLALLLPESIASSAIDLVQYSFLHCHVFAEKLSAWELFRHKERNRFW